jgi:hypothetical protein
MMFLAMQILAAIAAMADQVSQEPRFSLEVASKLFDWASFTLIGSLIMGAAATVLIVWMGIVKEHHWDLLRERGAHRVAELELETANANKETALARLATEKLRLRLVWRMIDSDAEKRLTERMKPFAPQHFAVLTYTDDPEASNLAALLRRALENAGWKFEGLGSLIELQVGVWLAWTGSSGTALANVVHPLSAAMKEAGAEPQGDVVGWPQLKDGVLYIVVGRKPPSAVEIPALEPLEKLNK